VPGQGSGDAKETFWKAGKELLSKRMSLPSRGDVTSSSGVKPFACRIFPAEGKNFSWRPWCPERRGRFTLFLPGLRAKPTLAFQPRLHEQGGLQGRPVAFHKKTGTQAPSPVEARSWYRSTCSAQSHRVHKISLCTAFWPCLFSTFHSPAQLSKSTWPFPKNCENLPVCSMA
jgi:hypothetical protein